MDASSLSLKRSLVFKLVEHAPDSAQAGTRLTLTNPATEPIKHELEPKTKEEPVDTHLVTELESELTEPATKQQAEARIKIEKFNQ